MVGSTLPSPRLQNFWGSKLSPNLKIQNDRQRITFSKAGSFSIYDGLVTFHSLLSCKTNPLHYNYSGDLKSELVWYYCTKFSFDHRSNH